MVLISEQETPSDSHGWLVELRIANPPPSLLIKYTRKEKAFFYDYAEFVVKIIKNPDVAGRLRRILALENVRIDGPLDIRVMVFPARSFRGQSNKILHGSYNSSEAQISLYPLRVPKEWVRNGGSDLFRKPFSSLSTRERNLVGEITASTIGTLLHEAFHVKIGSRGLSRYEEEAIVRKMEAEHMKGWDEIVSLASQKAFT